MASKQPTTIRSSCNGFALVAANGETLRDGFKSRALAAMWGTRRGIYQSSAPRRRKMEIPPELEDESIKKIPLLAKMSGDSYPTFLADAKAGKYGELYQLGNGFGLKFGNFKRGMAARIVK